MTPTPSDSAGGSTHAGADDAPGNPAAPHAPPAQAVPHFALGVGGFAQPAHSHGGGGPPAMGGAAHAQPAHSMQNSVFTARRWDRATGSTSTVGGVREKSEDSAGDSCGGGASHGGAVDGPVHSTQAQHPGAGAVRGGHGGHAASLSEDDGEEVEGGGRRSARGRVSGMADSARAATSGQFPEGAAAGPAAAPLETGPAAVDSAPPESVRFPTVGIGDGFVEAESGKFGINAAIAGGFAVGAAPARRAAGRGARRARAGGGKLSASGSGFNAGGGGTGESGDAPLTDPSDAYMARQPWELSAEEMLPAARALRARGANRLERGDWDGAERACEHALRFVEYEDAFDGAEAKADARAVRLECLVDLSACALELGDAQKAARVADAALVVDPSSADATLRRALAFAAHGAFDGAVADAEKAASLAPGDARVAAERARVLAMRDDALRASDGRTDVHTARGPERRAPGAVERRAFVDAGTAAAPCVSGPAVSAPLNKQPVPLFHARPPREINSRVPPGTAAAARALAAEEAEGECEAHRETNETNGTDADVGLGGMDIGVEAEGDERAEHGYAPAYSDEGEFGSPPGGSLSIDDVDGDGVLAHSGDGHVPRHAGAVGSDGAPQTERAARADVSGGGRGSGSLGHVPPNRPARPAVSGATPARDFSGQRGGLSAGPANGSMDVMGGGGGGQSFGNAPNGGLGAREEMQTLQTLSASAGARSMQKNAEGAPGVFLAQHGEVALGGDESEEDGEEIGSRNPAAREGVATGADEDMEEDAA